MVVFGTMFLEFLYFLVIIGVLVESFIGSETGSGEFQNRTMMYKAVNCCGCCHRVLEYSVPLGEDKIRGNQDTFSLVSFGQKSKEYLHFLLLLLDIPQVIYDYSLKAIQTSHFSLEGKVSFC